MALIMKIINIMIYFFKINIACLLQQQAPTYAKFVGILKKYI